MLTRPFTRALTRPLTRGLTGGTIPIPIPINVTSPEIDPVTGGEGTEISIVSFGTWDIPYDEYEVQWFLNGVEIAGETGDTLAVGEESDGDEITAKVRVRVTDGEWSEWVESNEFVYDIWVDINPTIRLESDYGVTTTGNFPAGFLDPVALITNRGLASDAEQPTSGCQGFYLPLIDGKGYLYNPDVSGNYASVPQTGLSGLQYIDIKAKITPSTFSGFNTICAKRISSTVEFGFDLSFSSLRAYADNGDETVVASSSVPLPYIPLDTFWVRVIIDAPAGEFTFFTSDDGVTWVQLGIPYSTTPWTTETTSLPVNFGALGDGTEGMRGAIHYVSISDASDVLCEVDFSDPTIPDNATSFECSTGQEVTINQSGDNPATLVRRARVRLDGVDDFYTGQFPEPIEGGFLYSVVSILGDGGENFACIFATVKETDDNDYDNPDGMVWIGRVTNTRHTQTYNNNAAIVSGPDPDSFSGLVFHMVQVQPGLKVSMKVNDFDEQENLSWTSQIESNFYSIGGSIDGSNNCAMDFFAKILLPHNAPEDHQQFVRNYLVTKYGPFA